MKTPAKILLQLGLGVLAVAAATPGLRANPTGSEATVQGTVFYPNQGPESVGNQTVVSFTDDSGFQAGSLLATAQISDSRTGTDASAGTGPGLIGVTGTSSVAGTVDASLGHLDASTAVSATSHDGTSTVYFPSNTAATINIYAGPLARFDDTTTVFNPNYAPGTLIPVELTLEVDWVGGWDLGSAGSNFAQSGATAILAVDGVGNVSAYDLKRTDLDPALWSYSGPQTFDFTVANGSSFTWWSSLTVFDTIGLNGLFQGGDPASYPTVSGSAYSNASIDLDPTSGLAGTIFTSDSGYVYGAATAAPGVPDENSTIGLLGLVVGLAGAGRRRFATATPVPRAIAQVKFSFTR